ncbi:unnamed protein product [Microthlaspi erraticum]|uniref:FKB95-like N-terminal Kelch domain-containing protein n=1 Tax=Microthlaspi erraticum TaxID=1685480 RepID=A0A6D2KQ95_9BRAS|nr:unnamed protein product [Microthlaspi erraticum]
MLVERSRPAANVVDGKIYVAGGVNNFNSSNWMEVFDPKTQTWEFVLCPLSKRCSSYISKNAVIEGRIFYMCVNKCVVYKPEEDRWEAIEGFTNLNFGWTWLSYCVIDKVLCSFRDLVGMKWYCTRRQSWMNMKGLIGLPKFDSYSCAHMADYDGKLAVFWTNGYGYKEKTIWCAVIAIEKRNGGEDIWGTVEWLDPLLTVPKSFRFECVVAATV